MGDPNDTPLSRRRRGRNRWPALGLLAALSVVAPALAPANARVTGPPYSLAGPEHDVRPQCDLAVPMSDGVRLWADLTTPSTPGRYPTIVSVTGYNKSGDDLTGCRGDGELYVRRGYNYLVVDDRGTGSSEGRWEIWGERTQRDYRELLSWIVAQPWSDGKVGATGASYGAVTSLFLAQAGHPALKAVWADAPMVDAYRDLAVQGGNVNTAFLPAWFAGVAAAGGAPPTWGPRDPIGAAKASGTHAANLAEFPADAVVGYATDGDYAYDGPFYRLRSPETRAAAITAPVAYTGGWYDIFVRGEARLYGALSRLGPEKKKWFQGPVYHTAGDFQWDALGLGPRDAVVLAWFDHWLRGIDNGVERIPSVNLWRTGADRWERPAAWPPPRPTWTRYLLGPERTLGLAAGRPSQDRLPLGTPNGVCTRSTAQWSAGLAGRGTPCENDNRTMEATALTYTTERLRRDMEITGPIAATLWAAVDRPEATFVVTVSDVGPDGRSSQVTSGTLNASHRAVDRARTVTNSGGEIIVPHHPFTREAQRPPPPVEPVEYSIEVLPTSYRFKAGHRLRVTVSTADYPHMAPTPRAGLAQAGGTATVLTGGRHPSRILLPVSRGTGPVV